MKNILTLIFWLIGLSCLAQSYPLSDFSLSNVGHVRSDEWYRLDTSNKSFAVSMVNGKLLIKSAIQTSAKEYVFTVGRLLTMDCGEWGGGLYFKPSGNLKRPVIVNGQPVAVDHEFNNFASLYMLPNDPGRKLIDGKFAMIAPGNVKDICPYHNDWLFASNFLSAKVQGWLSKLTIHQDTFVTTKLMDLKSAPAAIGVYKDRIFIATYNSFCCISNGKQAITLENLLWEGLSPNSIAIADDNTIYLGILGGYVKIDLSIKKVMIYGYHVKS